MLILNYTLAAAHVAALTQCDASTAIIDVRAIHDRDRDVAARPRRGTLPELWDWIIEENNAGRGIFINVNALDGSGRLASNVAAIRCQVLDLDGVDARQQYERVAASAVPPAFAVQSSPEKFHVYWQVAPHADAERFGRLQRKLLTEYNGDRKIIDPSRVLRLAGTYHQKGEPHLITCWSLASFGAHTSLDMLELMLADVDISNVATGNRRPLGSPELAAPSIEWIKFALADIDPNDLDRGEWTNIIAAVKQSGWSLADEATLQSVVMDWCARYRDDKPGENLKEWGSYPATVVGWSYVAKRSPNTRALGRLNGGYSGPPPAELRRYGMPVPPAAGGPPVAPDRAPMPSPPRALAPADMVASEILSADECAQYFDGCVFVASLGCIRTRDNRMLGSTEFNGKYGGKKFIIDSVGKITDEPWKAATRSTLWRVPQADHLRFVPSEPWGAMIPDAMGRDGLNIYYPITPRVAHGDVTPFLQHLALLLPFPDDQRIVLEYMAHNIKYPGHKIPWAPVIQSGQGAGKSIFREIMKWAIGGLYMHSPSAKELVDSGSKFNGWLMHKLFICVDEIRVDERRDLIEVLKPMISDTQIEVQKKGKDQHIEDNYANWMMFTNFKDAVPIDRDSRRFSVFYSAIQGARDLERRGMSKQYFDWLWNWLQSGGYAYVTRWMLDYPIERGAISMRSPVTSSMDEALRQSKSPLEKLIDDAIDDKITGFRGGFVSIAAVMMRAKQIGQMRVPSAKQIGNQLDAMGFRFLGRAPNLIPQEDLHSRPDIYGIDGADVAQYMATQGYR